MALTDYITQTAIALLLFTGPGLGPGTYVSATTFGSLAIGVFILQMRRSYRWLKRSRYGPTEWAWRSLTYPKIMAMRSL